MKKFFRFLLWLMLFGVASLLGVFLINMHVSSYKTQKFFNEVTDVPTSENPRVAIVLGAKVWDNGELSHALLDRVVTAVELYETGRVKKLLMTGDNPTPEYDEPTAMKKKAMELGVPESDIVMDFAGRRTYDSCYRAKEIFDVKHAVIVSQEFHQARSIYLCENMGIESVGVKANRRQYLGENYWAFREFFSVFSAWFEMNFIPFEPVKGEKEPIKL